MKLSVVKDSRYVVLDVFIQDSSATDGSGLTGLAYNTASLVCYYARPRTAATAISLITQTVTGAHAAGGFVEIDATNLPGWYRLDIPDAAVATGKDSVGLMLHGAADMAPVPIEIQLTDSEASEVLAVVENATYGLSALKTLIDAIQTAIDDADGGLWAIMDSNTAIMSELKWIEGDDNDNSFDGRIKGLFHIFDAVTSAVSKLTEVQGTGFVSADNGLKAISDAVDGVPGASGSTSVTYTLTKPDGSTPIPDARVWVSTDTAQANIIASGVTDDFGQVTFLLDSGTYYIWRKRTGYTFDNPDIEVVS